MTDIVVTIKRADWPTWLKLPNGSGAFRSFHIHGERPPSSCGDYLYVLAHGRIRCQMLFERATPLRGGWFIQATMIGPVTILGTFKGFPGWRRVWWTSRDELAFPDWQSKGVYYPPSPAADPAHFEVPA